MLCVSILYCVSVYASSFLDEYGRELDFPLDYLLEVSSLQHPFPNLTFTLKINTTTEVAWYKQSDYIPYQYQ